MIFWAIMSGNQALERPLYVSRGLPVWTSESKHARRFIYTRTAAEYLAAMRERGEGIGAKIVRMK